MAKITGTISRSDLEGGMWTLETSAGDRYQLMGALTDLKDGMQAKLEGKVEKNQMGIGMSGAIFTVSSVKSLGADSGC